MESVTPLLDVVLDAAIRSARPSQEDDVGALCPANEEERGDTYSRFLHRNRSGCPYAVCFEMTAICLLRIALDIRC